MNKRRDFLKTGALATVAPFVGQTAFASPPADPNTVQEAKRTLPVVKETDVIVCGGGPAGFAAALSAARNGAKTTLTEAHGCLGGVWTARQPHPVTPP